MESKIETFAEIVKEMRDRNEVRKVRLRQYGGIQCNCAIAPDDVPAVYADRIDAAHGREVETARIAACSAQARFDEALAAKNAEVAELRECLKVAEDALVAANSLIDSFCPNPKLESHRNAVENVRNAIAAIREEGSAK